MEQDKFKTLMEKSVIVKVLSTNLQNAMELQIRLKDLEIIELNKKTFNLTARMKASMLEAVQEDIDDISQSLEDALT